MRTQPNSRQFPSKEEALKDKKMHDLVYMLLQSMSEWSGDPSTPRYILKEKMNKSKMADTCGYKTRNTLYTHLKDLVKEGYLEETSSMYFFPHFQPGEYFLIPYDTALFLIATQTANVIKIYTYLANRWLANGQHAYQITYKKLCEVIGLYWNDQSNREVISKILLTLHNNYLITVTEPYYHDGYMACDVNFVGNIVKKRPV